MSISNLFLQNTDASYKDVYCNNLECNSLTVKNSFDGVQDYMVLTTTGTQNIVQGSVNIDFQNVEFKGTSLSFVPDREIVANVAGVYHITANIEFAPATGTRFLSTLVDGLFASSQRQPACANTNPGVADNLSCSATIFMDVGDIVVMRVVQDSGANLDVNTARLSAFKLF